MQIFALCQKGDADKLRALLSRTPSSWSEVNRQGQTPVMVASEAGEDDCVEALLEAAGAANINEKDKIGMTALAYAAQGGYQSVALMLLEAGADPLILDRDGFTILHHAVRTRMADLARHILNGSFAGGSKKKTAKGADASSTDESKAAVMRLLETPDPAEALTPLLMAARNLDREMIELLLSYKANLAAQDGEGNTCLHWVVVGGESGGDPELLELLLEADSALANVQNRQGQTPLHSAYEKYRSNAGAFVRVLSRYGADQTIRDKSGLLPSEAANPPQNESAQVQRSQEVEERIRARKLQKKADRQAVDDETLAWLEANKLQHLAAIFGQRRIDLSTVVELNPSKMKKLNIPLADHKALLAAIQPLKAKLEPEVVAESMMTEEQLAASEAKDRRTRLMLGVGLLIFFAALYVLFQIVADRRLAAKTFTPRVDYDQ